MLNKLTIKNIALIESLEIPFSKGLNVLSGETGSGKSVIIESLNFVLGAKADKSFIRNGAEECYVCAEFDVSDNPAIQSVFSEMDMDNEDILIISRRYSLSGKNNIKLNGTAATVGMLKKFTSRLVDVHGQSEHFELLSASNQLSLLDKFGGEDVAAIKDKLKTEYAEYKKTNEELTLLGGDESRRLMRLDVLNYQISEIEQCDLKENEEAELSSLREKLIYREKILSALGAVKSALSDEGGANDILGNAVRGASVIAGLGKEYSDIYERLQNLYAESEDIAECSGDLAENLDGDELNSDEIEDRLETIKKIKKKYGADYYEINKFLDDAKTEKERLENFNVIAENLLKKRDKLRASLYKSYVELSEKRRSYARVFSGNVINELRELGMENAMFEIGFSQVPSAENCKYDSANGFDNIEFMFSANLGEPLKPLSSVISGGEMSRFMLSVKAQSAKYNDISTFIFDEIDAGISGRVARVVAEKLFRISTNVQVLAISHLPQITSFADNNLLIFKSEANGLTYTGVKTLFGEERNNEIARLVGGASDNVSAKELAKSLISSAEDYKKNFIEKPGV